VYEDTDEIEKFRSQKEGVRTTSEQSAGENYFARNTMLNDSVESEKDQDTTQTIEEPLIKQ